MQKGLPILGVFREMFDKERIAKLKKGILIVNSAREAIMDTQAVVDACNNGHIAAFGDHTPESLLTDFGLYDPYWLLDIAVI
uniref:Formate dehydrogenase, mitochondrial n=1 Tax=Solanum tuberosum TaxID=4113 RepID=M1AGX2_SOLTU